MTSKSWEERAKEAELTVAELRNEVTHLRAVILAGEKGGFDGDSSFQCPWCQPMNHRDFAHLEHRPSCPAFSAPGVVR